MSVKTPHVMKAPPADPAAAPAAVPPALLDSWADAATWGFVGRAGARLRWGHWPVTGSARGTVVLLPGRAEFIEKYATEVVGELLQRGWDVLAFDWRGQGLSDRSLPDRHKGDIDDFATYDADFAAFLDQVVRPLARPPVLALAHSMGGHIVLRALAESGPGPFAAALLSAPMTGLKHEGLLRAVLAVTRGAWLAPRYLPGGGPFDPAGHRFPGNVLTHDPRRFAFTPQWFAADPRLALGGPTFGWARAALRSLDRLRQPGFLERLDLPLLILSAADDTLVDPGSHAPVAARLPRGRCRPIAGARHEILMETDPVRAAFWQAFDGFAADLGR